MFLKCFEKNIFKCFCPIFNVVFLFLLKHKRTKLQIWSIYHKQIALSPVFDLYHNHRYITTFNTCRSLLLTNGYCADFCQMQFNVFMYVLHVFFIKV